jgi:hypothetical protein
MDFFGRSGGYSYSELQEAQLERPVTANDLVDNSGACPAMSSAAQPQPAQGNSPPGPAPDAAVALGGGVGLGMSECEVVNRAGAPTSVQLGTNPNGDRTAVLSYSSGPRPGIYRFERGRLMEMDRVAEASNPPQDVRKKAAKRKKPVKTSAAM